MFTYKEMNEILKALCNYFVGSSYGVMPIEGSVFTYFKKGSAYNGMTGVVKYHEGGDGFMIECDTNCLCNIKP